MNLKPGDILAFSINKNTTNLMSKLISWISRYTVGNWLNSNQTSYSHIAIVAEDVNFRYEEVWAVSRRIEIDHNLDKYDMIVLEYDGITDEQREDIIEYCKNNMNESYDWLRLFTFGLLQMEGHSICSEFAAQAYLYAGINLYKEGEVLISPNEIVYHQNMIKK